jgi:ribonucleotide reductase beta subunit family protein with ferritin-like domain
LISRDEALHTEFAILLYSKLEKKLDKNEIYKIVRESVDIETVFITEAIPCRLIGMNASLMTEYIEFVADRLVVQLGYEKIYHTKNPFDFMEMISVQSKTNFFEKRVSEYALADKKISDDVFELTSDF